MNGESFHDRRRHLLEAEPVPDGALAEIGASREGRPIRGARIGEGGLRISLLAGCHADEPAGPRLLRRVLGFLVDLPASDPWRTRVEWWILPHLNPDGAAHNRAWTAGEPDRYDPAEYVASVAREAPPDDVEFGFPRRPDDRESRPENRAAFDWWCGAAGPFDLHASLHGMAVGEGPWFLIDADWRHRCRRMVRRCRERAAELGYQLHDVDRHGEKGFERLAPGFATRPDSRAMRAHFMGRGEPEMAERFRPSSMETMKALGGDPLTVVSEVPLFRVEEFDPEDRGDAAALRDWKERLRRWREELGRGAEMEALRRRTREAGVEPVPVREQMDLQWTLVAAAVEAVIGDRDAFTGDRQAGR